MGLDEIKDVAKDFADKAVAKTGEVVEVSKLRLELSKQQGRLRALYQKLGSSVYSMKEKDYEDLDLIDNLCQDITENLKLQKKLQGQIAALKKMAVCPVCGSSVTERQKGFFCSNKQCRFALWKNSRYFESIGKSMTSATAQKLLGSGKIKLKGCKSAKTGNTFDATVYMEVFEDGKTRFNMEFDNGGKRK